jgi:hypothetical protein
MARAPQKPKAGKTLPTDLLSSEHAHNDMVVFQVSGLLSFDGNPDTPGMEYYAPDDFDEAAHCAANGIDALVDGDGNPVKIEGSWFECPRITAKAMERAKLGRIAS